MADTSDVEAALVAAVQPLLPALIPAATVIRGWPEPAALQAASTAGTSIVTVFQRANFNRNTSRYPAIENDLVNGSPPGVPPSLTVTMGTNTATFAGTCSTDQIAGVAVHTVGWATRCGATDTPTTIAAALAALSGGTTSGPVLTLTGISQVGTARDVPVLLPTRQQSVGFSVIAWCPDPISRDTICSAIDAGLSNIERLLLADGSYGRLTWAGTVPTDRAQQSNLYRRDLFYTVDFSTTLTIIRTPALFPGVTINTPSGVVSGVIHS